MSYTKRMWEDFVERVLELEQKGYTVDEIIQALNSSKIIISTILNQHEPIRHEPRSVQQGTV
jgi:orotate phosphoribosyltransferase-like protein